MTQDFHSEVHTHVHTETWTPAFTAVEFIKAARQKRPRCPPAAQQSAETGSGHGAPCGRVDEQGAHRAVPRGGEVWWTRDWCGARARGGASVPQEPLQGVREGCGLGRRSGLPMHQPSGPRPLLCPLPPGPLTGQRWGPLHRPAPRPGCCFSRARTPSPHPPPASDVAPPGSRSSSNKTALAPGHPPRKPQTWWGRCTLVHNTEGHRCHFLKDTPPLSLSEGQSPRGHVSTTLWLHPPSRPPGRSQTRL